jgi:hypothetical protein
VEGHSPYQVHTPTLFKYIYCRGGAGYLGEDLRGDKVKAKNERTNAARYLTQEVLNSIEINDEVC